MGYNSKEKVVLATGLEKTFRDFWRRPRAKAVRGIDFEVRSGEVVGLLGPNGSGKSTTIKMLLGLLKPTAGSVKIFGKSPDSADVKSRVGYLPELSYLYKYLTPRETLRYYAGLFDMPGSAATEKISELLELTGIADEADRQVGEFSKGMARRVGLAQALINNPDLVVLDEPTSGLDPIGRHDVKLLIRKLAEAGKTVLLSTHLLSEVEDVCNRVIILAAGKIAAQGTLDDILSVSGVTALELSNIDDKEYLDEFCAGIKARGGNVSISHPKRSLEKYFLDILNEDRQ